MTRVWLTFPNGTLAIADFDMAPRKGQPVKWVDGTYWEIAVIGHRPADMPHTRRRARRAVHSPVRMIPSAALTPRQPQSPAA